ncbi:MAG: D-alanyl-D-alanine carboxypeptidase/D-alanyl-D-alanine-endopeptidase [Pyrinomonadaceae bacterium]|nr:D-alanyl-D-alanine carboxypeptidase/D-alanyl-D-alanine-endopeptidase [Pyrinomonadaceae bacterium]
MSFATLSPARAQEGQRERRAITPAPTPVAPVGSTVPAPVIPVAPSSSTLAVKPVAPTTIEELRARIQEVLRQPQLAPAQVAVKVVSLDTGRTLYEENAGKLLQPASNMKLYTVAAALDRLSPNYRFTTSAYAPVRPDASGTMRGDLTVYGRGDPSFATRFNDGDYNRALDDFAAQIAAAGVRRVEGDLVGDESYFTGAPFAPGWEADDLQWYYGAEISALSINDNALDLFVRPGVRVGEPCTVTTGPATPLVTIINRTLTQARGTRRELKVYRPLGENTIEVSGFLAQDDPGYTASVAISRPAMLFVSLLRSALERRGIVITGRTRTVDGRARGGMPLTVSSLVEIAQRQSPPLSIIAGEILKPSQNLYTELVLRTLGRTLGTDLKQTSGEAGIKVVGAFLQEAGVGSDKLIMNDGSGLSRGDFVTVDGTLQLLVFMDRHRYSSVFRDALPIAGVDGTLRNRMKGTPAAGNVRAKTGTLNTVATLSGYATSAAGERLVFSVFLNNHPIDTEIRRSSIDAIAVLIASFAGRS